MIDKTVLHYKIIEKLGEGGMGVVYLAEDTKLKRQVAIKFLPRHVAVNSEERERFKLEAQAAASLNHPNISHIYAIEEVEDDTCIVMEYIDGEELKEKVRSQKLEVRSAIKTAIQIAEGLQAAHEKEIKTSGAFLLEAYLNNVWPEMRVTWGTYRQHLGHQDADEGYGCFRCHDDEHETKYGKIITQDCDMCHDEPE